MTGLFIEEKYKIPLVIILIGALLIGGDIVSLGLLSSGGFPTILVGCLLVILGGIVILFIKKNEIMGEISRRIQDYFTKNAIISIISVLVALVIYLISAPPDLVSAVYRYFNIWTYGSTDYRTLLSLVTIPFLLIGMIFGLKGFKEEKVAIVEMIGGIIGLILLIMSILPFIVSIIGLAVPFFI
ncbi:MAG: hypothetical protein ACFE8M_08625 [Candidatus Hermodarchaeota archaeon]